MKAFEYVEIENLLAWKFKDNTYGNIIDMNDESYLYIDTDEVWYHVGKFGGNSLAEYQYDLARGLHEYYEEAQNKNYTNIVIDVQCHVADPDNIFKELLESYLVNCVKSHIIFRVQTQNRT